MTSPDQPPNRSDRPTPPSAIPANALRTPGAPDPTGRPHRPRPKRPPLHVVYTRRVRCPECDDTALARTRGPIDQGDASVLHYVRCRKCGASFKWVEE